ncbi:MAG: long-chain-fatty-acid--CoA ligase [Gammaproteobacteria bacterium]|jgi:long-chain acyl-CoA synthetase|nr:long-chain-fatty-acid--CoA ligase [Gammaproteobacteria bacterium]
MACERGEGGTVVDKIWLKQYPKGVPAEVNVDQFASLRDILKRSCTKYRDLPAFTNMGVTLSYRDIDALSRNFGAYLQKTIGLRKGDRVAIMMPNLLQYPIALFGILRSGMVAVNVNPLYTPRELEHQLNDSGAKAIVVLENFAHTLEKVLNNTPIKTVITTQIGELFPFPKSLIVNFVVKRIKKMVPAWNIPGTTKFKGTLTSGKSQQLDEVEINHNDAAFLQYTGGTTGVAKGAELTHGNMVANVQQASAWLAPISEEGTEVVITALPLYHIFSLTVNCLTFMKVGGQNILITNPRDFVGFVNELKKVRFSCFIGVNTLFNALLNTPGFSELDFSRLTLTLGGGMAVQRAVAESWKAVTGVPIIEAYGLTETSPGICVNPLTITDYTGSIGVPISSTEVSIQDDDGNELGIGDVGEICARGPQVMRGYWNRPEETAKVLSKDGWFRTGDIGRMDEKGYVYIEDRKKDMILVSGFNVYPNEIESVVVEHDGILEAAAIGIPDARSGEAVKLFVVKRDPELTVERVLEHCRNNLTGYKVPKRVEFRDELPKTNVGKILRRALRDTETPS